MTEDKEDQPPIWINLTSNLDQFLNELECLEEMHEMVTPYIHLADQKRIEQLQELTEEVDDPDEKGKKIRKIKDNVDFEEILKITRKMSKANIVYRHNLITSIVSKFDEFLEELLLECFKHNPSWLKGSEKKLTYKEVLETDSLEELKEELILREIDSLMRDSHYIQLDFLDDKFKLGLKKEYKRWTDVLEITERRNLYVHNGGKVNQVYLENCKKFGISVPKELKEESHLFPTDEYIENSILVFFELSVRLTHSIGRRMFAGKEEELEDDLDTFLNEVGISLLHSEKWKLAELIFEFALSIPEKHRSKGEYHFYFLINLCISLKEQKQDFSKLLAKVNWVPFHPKFHFAIAVLNDNWNEAIRLMSSESVHSEINEEGFKTWPLLRLFRKRDDFKMKFEEIFGKNFEDELKIETEAELEAQQDVSSNSETLRDSESSN